MVATADAIDTPGPYAVSFLPHGPNVAAQALLRDARLRAFGAPTLARSLSISTRDAMQGIASVTGMVDRIARRGRAALQPEPKLELAIGPFLSLDQAMARYASHRGPIVVSPSPVFRPDAGRFHQGFGPEPSKFSEAGETNVSDQGDPANADQGQPTGDQGNTPDQGYGGGGGAEQEQPPQVITPDQGGGGATNPLQLTPGQSGPAPAAQGGSSSKWWWIAAGAAAVVYALSRKKRRA